MSLSSTRLELLLKVAEKAEGEARDMVAEAERREAEVKAILAELEKYLAEYEAKPMALVSPVLLENRRQFNLRLQGAIAQQQRSVAEVAARTVKARERWQSTRKEVMVTETLLGHARVEDRKLADKRSQREMDEFAMIRRHAQAAAP